ncbi:MAG: KpsF/GutQ family sugar-phosphate isomerase [Ignavibacteria bacterium]|nr:KpsF/GutQ family sugar-phosphate isomerase [Ignavibacteria bacterium]
MDSQQTIEHGRTVIRIEAAALTALVGRIGQSFADAVNMIHAASGRVVVTGVGKSGLIARKIVATMNSTGTPAIFLHPADAVHGDLGMVTQGDVVLVLSKSGNTEEIRNIFPMFRQIGVKTISIIGSMDSYLAKHSDIALDGSVEEEACPHDLAPTSSTTVALALGDAIAIALLQQRGFTVEDFAFYHPGGSLGKRLLLSIEQIMTMGDAVPVVRTTVPLTDAILEMTGKRLGATCVINGDGTLAGMITDGDLRRLLEKHHDINNLLAEDAMSRNPKMLYPNALASFALEMMEQYKITQLVVVNQQKQPVGIVHMHDLIQLGLR